MPALRPAELVARLGGSAAARLGIDPGSGGEEALGRWLVAACLLAAARDEAGAVCGFSVLLDAGLADPAAIRASGPLPLAQALERAGLAKADQIALTLSRASAALFARHRGSLDALVLDAEGLDELASRLCALAPGIGRATVALFLRPLRERWTAASELPLAPAARSAALCLGWLHGSEDEDGAPGTLRARLLSDREAPTLDDVESALARLGALACVRRRSAQCPLAQDCPARERALEESPSEPTRAR